MHQKGHTDNETRLFAVAKYFFPMLLQTKKCQGGGRGEALLQPRGLLCPRQEQCPELDSCLGAPLVPPLQGCCSTNQTIKLFCPALAQNLGSSAQAEAK